MTRTRVTIRDVAEVAQVSRMTVLRVLQNKPDVAPETRRRIMEVMERLGYAAATSDAQPGTSRVLGLLTPDIGTTPIGGILRGVSRATEHLGYGLMLYSQHSGKQTTHAQSPSIVSPFITGTLLIYPHDHENIIKKLKGRNLPYVIIDHLSGTQDEPGVTTTNRKGVLDAMRHLLALGHRRIGFITGNPELVASHDRLRGYQDGLAELGLPYDPELIRPGDFVQPTGFREAQFLLELSQPPTAIVASNDMMAFGVMDAAKARGLVIGQDISIIGFDDVLQAADTYPPLTTVRQPLEAMGEAAVDLLVTLIERPPALSLHRELPTELIIRETTGYAMQPQEGTPRVYQEVQ